MMKKHARWKLRMTAGLAASAMALSTIMLIVPAAASTTKVHPGGLGSWTVGPSFTSGTRGDFVNGPGTPPLGVGSFHLAVRAPSEFPYVGTDAHRGLRLDAINELKYSTYQAQSGPAAAVLKIVVDTNGTGAGSKTLKFEPADNQSQQAQQALLPNTWQTWDARNGQWWETGSGPRFTLNSFLADHPDTVIALGTLQDGPAIRLEVGSTSAVSNFDGNVDNFTLNTNTSDFELFGSTLDCDANTDDVAAVQQQINVAPNNSTLKLKGTCDFSGAPAHGGDIYESATSAVTINKAITIESDGPQRSATVLGSGVQTAFHIVPGTSNVTIRGLNFTNLGRPIYIENSSNITIGGGTTINDPNGNRIIGNSTMDSAILAVAKGSGTLSDINVLGNYISYNPPGLADGSTRDVVAVDIRKIGGTASGFDISRNAVGMFSSEFPSINMNGVRVYDHSAGTITNVKVNNNNLGRLEEVDGLPAGDFNVGDVHAAGRAGIFFRGVDGYEVVGNGVRARLSPTAVPMPGGGIVLGDSSNGSVSANGIIVITDPSTASADLGAIGLIDDIEKLFGYNSTGPATTNNRITNNIVGAANGSDPVLGAGRGIVLNGASLTVATGNTIRNTTEAAINIGVAAQGPGSTDSPGIATLQGAVTQSVICTNSLDGVNDDPTEIEFSTGSANAFPGGSVANSGCVPVLNLSPGVLNSTGSVTASGRGWALKPLRITVSKGTSSVVRNLTAEADGTYTSAFNAADLSSISDGTLTVTVRASDTPSGIFRNSAIKAFTKDTTAPAVPVIVNPTNGATITGVTGQVQVTGTAEPGSNVRIYNSGDSLLGSGLATGGNFSITIAFADGAHSIYATASDAAANTASSGLLNFTVDTAIPTAPVITPMTDVQPKLFTVGGTSDPGVTVKLYRGSVLLGTTLSTPSGTWSKQVTGVEATNTVTATATSSLGKVSAISDPLIVQVDAFAPVSNFGANPLVINNYRVLAPGEAIRGTTTDARGVTEITIRYVNQSNGSVIVNTVTACTPCTGTSVSWSDVPVLPPGQYTATVVGKDAAGNVGTKSTFMVKSA
ncbi:MAG: Ig-like domain-containing protein [Actinomycetota bacterium]